MILYALIGVLAVNRKKIKIAYQRSLERKRMQEEQKKKRRGQVASSYQVKYVLPQARITAGPEVLQESVPSLQSIDADFNPGKE